ncbi:streptomycin 6-kinase [Streptomyces sp. WMMB 714]|uniref:aminoglycoside phosphotransferase family protein n=1 Tax=Streptomyces sp. WMMB 714 TaxID=1286822 RepID=UPI0005F82AF4|nr:aminoglycoside phosphotransferase family protein [Streptomyces sp. WMMB 714]SCK44786.1 streptomycin 6-kinase [Streptomyces sp. WMMB 714]
MTPADLFPDSLPVTTAMRRTASGRDWLGRLPSLVEELRRRWNLRLGSPYEGGSCSWVAPAERRDGTRAVLKVTWPHREARPEGEALRLWAGDGAVRVYEHDPREYALLLERCEPGTQLGEALELPAEERLVTGAGVLRALWDSGRGRRPGPDSAIEDLAGATGRLADVLDERAGRRTWPPSADTGLFRQASSLLRELPRTAPLETVVHGDFNPGNVLASGRRPWLAIDAKPLYGDVAFDPWPLIQQIDDPFAYPSPERVLARRTALVADELGLDAARLHAWAMARLVEFALWQLDVDGGDTEHEARLNRTVRLVRQARVLAELAGL